MSAEVLTSPTDQKSPESRTIELISSNVLNPEEIVSPTELLDLVDSLPALNPMELLGEWSAGSFNTRHPAHGWLRSINWVGITFRSVDDVEPIVVAAQTRDGPGKGHRRKWLDEWGNAEVIEAKYRGVVSAAMVCDNHPVVNHFRKVTDNVVLGIMSAKMYRHAGLFFFYLTRL